MFFLEEMSGMQEAMVTKLIVEMIVIYLNKHGLKVKMTNFAGEGKNKIGTKLLNKLTWKMERVSNMNYLGLCSEEG